MHLNLFWRLNSKRALSNQVNYFYDALNGFAYKMDGHVIPHSNTKPVINLEAEMNGMTSASTFKQLSKYRKDRL